ncbi:hypothetical protein [Hyphomonas sp. UBA5107]|nr:hypothetical protein [Hyphomonas sp. UBA5107]
MKPAVSILERVDVDTSECQNGSGDDGIHQRWILIIKGEQVLRAGA